MSPRAATATKAPPKPKVPTKAKPAPRPTVQPSATVDRKALLDAIARVLPAVTGRHQPVLKGVHIKCAKGRLTVSATDLDLWLSTWVEADTDRAFEASVSPGVLSDLIRWAPGPIHLAPNGEEDGLNVSFGKTEATLRTFSLGDWPTWRVVEGRTVSLSGPDVAVLRRVIFAASQDEARPILTGVLFEGNSVVATDSYRLVIGTVEADLGEPAMLLAKSVRFLPAKMLEGELVEVTVGAHEFAWEFDRLSVVTRRIKGEFPNYKPLIPKAAGLNRYTMSRADLIMAVKRAESVIPKRDRTKPVRFQASDNELVVEANVADVGVVREPVDAQVEGMLMSFAFNPLYFRECLAALVGDTVTIQMLDALRPAMMVEHDLTVLLMPVRISA